MKNILNPVFLIMSVFIIAAVFITCGKQEIKQDAQDEITRGKKPGGGSTNSIPAPSNVRVVRTGAAQVKITWNSVSGATSYWVYRENIVLAIVTDTMFVDNYASISYGYAVAAVVNSVLGTKSPYATELISPLAQTARLNRDMFVHVGVKSDCGCFDPPTDNNKGIAYTVMLERMKMQGDYTKSNWAAMNARGIIGGIPRDIFFQGGCYTTSSNRVELAWQIYDLTTRSQISGLDLDTHYSGNNILLEEGQLTRFEMQNIEGTTRWAFRVNGLLVFDANLGFEEASNFPPEIGSRNQIEVATESRGGDDFNPKLHFLSFEYFKDGEWKKVPSARSTLSVINDPTGKANGWNVTGVSGVTAEFYIGGSGTPTSPGTLIW